MGKTAALALELEPDLLELLLTSVIGYVRVSDPSQLDSNSLEQQALMIEQWCNERGHRLDSIYFDPGISGAKLKERSGLIAAIQRTKSDPNVAGICFFNFDRFFRDIGLSEMVRKSLQLSGKQIYSTEQQMDLTDKYGVFNFQIQQSVAELKRKEIIDLLYKRRMAKGANGGWIGGRVPYGKRPEQGELVDDLDEKRTIRLILRLRKWVKPNGKRMTTQAITDYINNKLDAEIAHVRSSDAFMRSLAALSPEQQHIAILDECCWVPKHARRLVRVRHRPYHKPRAMRWTRNCILGILWANDIRFNPRKGELPEETVRLIFSMHKHGMTKQQIAARLTQLGIPTARKKQVWSYVSVGGVLRHREPLAEAI